MTTSLKLPRQRCRLLGISVTPGTLENLLDWAQTQVKAEGCGLILGHNLHSAYLYHRRSHFRRLYESASVVLADGAPVIADLWLSGSRLPVNRIGSTDWLSPFLRTASGLRVLVIGATADSNSAFVELVRRLNPSHTLLGLPGDPWSQTLQTSVIKTIRDFNPDFVLVGLGMPLQEHLIAKLIPHLDHGLIAAVGGAIDQLVGKQRNAPRWLGRFGFEWLWRLASQPRRLAHRYLIEPWKLFAIRLRSFIKNGGGAHE